MSLMDGLLKMAGGDGGGLGDLASMGRKMSEAHELAAESVALQRQIVTLLTEQNLLQKETNAWLRAISQRLPAAPSPAVASPTTGA